MTNHIWVWAGKSYKTEDDAMRAYLQDTAKDHTMSGKDKPKRYVLSEYNPPREWWTWAGKLYDDKDAAYAAFRNQKESPYKIISPPYKLREVQE